MTSLQSLHLGKILINTLQFYQTVQRVNVLNEEEQQQGNVLKYDDIIRNMAAIALQCKLNGKQIAALLFIPHGNLKLIEIRFYVA